MWSAECERDGPSVSMIAWSDSDSVAFGISSVDNYMSLSSISYFTSYIFLLLRLWQLKILSLELQVA